MHKLPPRPVRSSGAGGTDEVRTEARGGRVSGQLGRVGGSDLRRIGGTGPDMTVTRLIVERHTGKSGRERAPVHGATLLSRSMETRFPRGLEGWINPWRQWPGAMSCLRPRTTVFARFARGKRLMSPIALA